MMEFVVAENQISELQMELAVWTCLTTLTLSNNAFVEVPPVVFLLTTLQRLLLRSNLINKLAPAVGDWRDLVEFSIAKCPIESLPCTLALIPKLPSWASSSSMPIGSCRRRS
jgi:Leucine-rich repeat (LRR) protein